MCPAGNADSAPLTRLRARWVVPVSQRPLQNAVVEIHGGLIRAVRPARRHAGRPCTDLGAVVLLPGLINAHAHLELTALAGTLPRSNFWTWLGLSGLLARRQEQTDPAWHSRSVRDGAGMCLRSGTTCVGDISRTADSWRTLAESPIRKCCFAELISIAQRPPRDLAELAAALEQTPIRPGQLWPAVTAHAPYTVTARDIAATAALARDKQMPWAIHLAETPEEVQWLESGRGAVCEFLQQLGADQLIVSPHTRPIEYLRRLGALGEGTLIVHGNYLTGEDLDLLAADGGALVYCPGAHRWFGHPRYPLGAAVERRIPVALGTDSLACSESLSMLEEVISVRQAHPELDFAGALAMATTVAARVLGCPAGSGTLQPGAPADLVAVAGPAGRCDSYEVCLEPGAQPVGVWLAGRAVVPAEMPNG